MERADLTLSMMTQRDPSLERLLAKSAGYVVIPDVGEGGFMVGAQQGVGVVYERGGNPIGFAVLRQGSIGAQIGARSFGELIVLGLP
jgi:lipid-binding SYLF domain-containing protein